MCPEKENLDFQNEPFYKEKILNFITLRVTKRVNTCSRKKKKTFLDKYIFFIIKFTSFITNSPKLGVLILMRPSSKKHRFKVNQKDHLYRP